MIEVFGSECLTRKMLFVDIVVVRKAGLESSLGAKGIRLVRMNALIE